MVKPDRAKSCLAFIGASRAWRIDIFRQSSRHAGGGNRGDAEHLVTNSIRPGIEAMPLAEDNTVRYRRLRCVENRELTFVPLFEALLRITRLRLAEAICIACASGHLVRYVACGGIW
jgi:hypothetical protein